MSVHQEPADVASEMKSDFWCSDRDDTISGHTADDRIAFRVKLISRFVYAQPNTTKRKPMHYKASTKTTSSETHRKSLV